jgi:zinc transporter ZupT
MVRGRSEDLPPALGWLLAVAGGLVVGFVTIGYVPASFAVGGFSADAGSLIVFLGFVLLGVLALLAGSHHSGSSQDSSKLTDHQMSATR